MSILKRVKYKLNSIIRRSYWFNEVAFRDCEKMKNHSRFDLDIVNLGSTSGYYAFNYEGQSINASNWALRPNSLFGDLLILENYSSYLKSHGSVVLLPLCPFSFLSGSYNFLDDRYYTFLSIQSIPYSSFKHKEEVLYKYQNPLLYYPLMEFFFWIKRSFSRKSKSLDSVGYDKDAQRWLKNWLFEFSLSSLDAPFSLVNKDGISDATSIIETIIDYCHYCNSTPVLVMPPVTRSLANLFTDKAKDRLFLDPVKKLIEKKGVLFLNYFCDKEISNNYSLFNDAYLLNKKGAIIFTKRVIEDIYSHNLINL